MVASECCKSRTHRSLVQPVDDGRSRLEQVIDSFGSNKLDGPGAVFPDFGYEGKGVPRRHLESAAPGVEDVLVVGEKIPQERFDPVVVVFGCGKGHGKRERGKAFLQRRPAES